MKKTLPKLYKKRSDGSLQHWTIEVDGKKHRTVAGKEGGKTVTSKWTIAKPKNVGKANETTPEEQAAKEAQAKWDRKKEGEYGTKKEAQAKGGAATFIKPMLALKYEDKNRKKEILKAFKTGDVYGQPKLDGVRCIISKDGMQSRKGKKVVSAPHIFKALQPFFKKHPDIIFDGELYSHDLSKDFNRIIELAKKTKPTAQDLKESEETLQYWVYDIVPVDEDNEINFTARNLLLKQFVKSIGYKMMIYTPTFSITSEEDLDEKYKSLLEDDYEGMILRRGDLPYMRKKCKALLKHKPFEDAEYEIVDITEGKGNGSGMAGRCIMLDHDGERTFGARPKGSHAFLKDLLENKEEYIGKEATVRYNNLTPDGIPRFPRIVAIRDYE